MKKLRPFLIVCIAAMAIASVAGFISFKKAFNDGTLSNLYKEKKEPLKSEKTTPAATPAVVSGDENKSAAVETTTSIRNSRRRNKRVNLESFSRAEIRPPLDTFGSILVDTGIEK